MEGLQLQVAKNCVDAIKTRVDAIRVQIEMMQQMEKPLHLEDGTGQV